MEAILTVADHRVTLLCDAARLRHYACLDRS